MLPTTSVIIQVTLVIHRPYRSCLVKVTQLTSTINFFDWRPWLVRIDHSLTGLDYSYLSWPAYDGQSKHHIAFSYRIYPAHTSKSTFSMSCLHRLYPARNCEPTSKVVFPHFLGKAHNGHLMSSVGCKHHPQPAHIGLPILNGAWLHLNSLHSLVFQRQTWPLIIIVTFIYSCSDVWCVLLASSVAYTYLFDDIYQMRLYRPWTACIWRHIW